jgi:hypothetical protein
MARKNAPISRGDGAEISFLKVTAIDFSWPGFLKAEWGLYDHCTDQQQHRQLEPVAEHGL